MRKIVKAHLSPEQAETLEAQEAAQATGYFAYMPGTVVFTGDWEVPNEHLRGRLTIGLESAIKPNAIIRGGVLQVQDERGKTLVEMDPAFGERYSHKITGRWLRLPKPPASGVSDQILREASSLWPEIAQPRLNNGPDILGLLFPEQVQLGQPPQENWIFIVRRKAKAADKRIRQIESYLGRSDRASRANSYARVNRCAPLEDKKLLLVGLGAIGEVAPLVKTVFQPR